VQKCKSKFERAFTKLRAWELEEFPKVVLLDTDLLVRRNVDELFDLPTPTAYMRGHQEHFPRSGNQRSISTTRDPGNRNMGSTQV